MLASNINTVVGYSLSMVTALAAVTILTGFLMPPEVPTQLRVMFGIVLALLAVYRAVITWMQSAQRKRSVNDENDSE